MIFAMIEYRCPLSRLGNGRDEGEKIKLLPRVVLSAFLPSVPKLGKRVSAPNLCKDECFLAKSGKRTTALD